jgi:hypothetical protein
MDDSLPGSIIWTVFRYVLTMGASLLVSTLFGGSVHRVRSILIRTTNRRRCNLRIGLSCLRRADQVRNLRSRLML